MQDFNSIARGCKSIVKGTDDDVDRWLHGIWGNGYQLGEVPSTIYHNAGGGFIAIPLAPISNWFEQPFRATAMRCISLADGSVWEVERLQGGLNGAVWCGGNQEEHIAIVEGVEDALAVYTQYQQSVMSIMSYQNAEVNFASLQAGGVRYITLYPSHGWYAGIDKQIEEVGIECNLHHILGGIDSVAEGYRLVFNE